MRQRIQNWLDTNFGKAAALSNWLCMGVHLVANLLIVPLVLRAFGKEQAGVWFFLLGWVAFFQLCDFGIAQSVSRQISFSSGKRGARRRLSGDRFLRMYGQRADEQLFLCARLMFRRISWIILIVGILLERTVLFTGELRVTPEARLTWYLILATGILTNEARSFTAWLTGRLLVQWERLYTAAGIGVQSVLVIVALWLGASLWLVGVLYFFGAAIQWWLLRKLYRQHAGVAPAPELSAKRGLLRAIWAMSWEQGVATTAAYFIFSFNPILIGYFIGAGAVAEFHVPLRIAAFLQAALLGLFTPQLNVMIRLASEQEHRRMVSRFVKLFVVVALAGLAVFGAYVVLGPWVIRGWTIGRIVSPFSLLALLAVCQYLAVLQVMCACFVLAHGEQPFAVVAVCGAVLNVGLAVWWIPQHGLAGAALATLVAQALTSNWYVPLLCFRRLRGYLREHGSEFLWNDLKRLSWRGQD
jgi:O-antigen/teichoic acid export membrane protein